MNRIKAPARRKEARSPAGGLPSMRPFIAASIVVHAALLTALSRPAAEPPRPVFAEPIYQVALLPSPEPNYEPPVPTAPAPPKKVEPKKAPIPKPHKDAVAIPDSKPKKTPKKPEPVQKPAAETAPVKSQDAPRATNAPVSLGDVDQKEFTQDWYLETIRVMLARAWDPPTGGTGLLLARIHLVIRRDGSIERPEVIAGTGWGLYDRSTISAVLTVHKFPPLPQDYPGDELGLTVNFQRLGDAE
jgi:outer membrane biosynthesis protein TonB